MKKLLSIMAAFTMTATAASTVVACGNIKHSEKPTYDGFWSIEGKSYTSNNQVIVGSNNSESFLREESNKENTKKDVESMVKKYKNQIIGTMATSYKNDEEFVKNVSNFGINVISFGFDSKDKQFLDVKIAFTNESNGQKYESKKSIIRFDIRNDENKITEYSKDNSKPMKINILPGSDGQIYGSKIYNIINLARQIGSDSSSIKDDDLKKIINEINIIPTFDGIIRYYSNYLDGIQTPGYKENGVRYTSIYNQIKEENGGQEAFEKAVTDRSSGLLSKLISIGDLDKIKEVSDITNDLLKEFNTTIKDFANVEFVLSIKNGQEK